MLETLTNIGLAILIVLGLIILILGLIAVISMAVGLKKVIQGVSAATKTTMLLYEVQEGDTLFSICDQHEVNWGDVMKLNAMRNTEDIRVGQRLLLKEATYEPKK